MLELVSTTETFTNEEASNHAVDSVEPLETRTWLLRPEEIWSGDENVKFVLPIPTSKVWFGDIPILLIPIEMIAVLRTISFAPAVSRMI